MKIKENFLLFSVTMVFCISVPLLVAVVFTHFGKSSPKENATYILPLNDTDCKQIAVKVSIEYDKTKLPSDDTVKLYNMIYSACLLHLVNAYEEIKNEKRDPILQKM